MQRKLGLIAGYLGEPEVLAQLAEEAAELAQAALKMRRAITGKNPTPKSVEECQAALMEEMADVTVCAGQLGYLDGAPGIQIGVIMSRKAKRWYERLLNAREGR